MFDRDAWMKKDLKKKFKEMRNKYTKQINEKMSLAKSSILWEMTEKPFLWTLLKD